jgi:hypothetical protein
MKVLDQAATAMTNGGKKILRLLQQYIVIDQG